MGAKLTGSGQALVAQLRDGHRLIGYASTSDPGKTARWTLLDKVSGFGWTIHTRTAQRLIRDGVIEDTGVIDHQNYSSRKVFALAADYR